MPRAQKPKNGRDKSPGDRSKGRQEVEVKLRIADRSAFLRQLGDLGATPSGPRVHEMNTLYDTPEGQLASGGQMARIRVERPTLREPQRNRGKAKDGKAGRAAAKGAKVHGAQAGPVATLTYKGPPSARGGGYKVREEHEVRIANTQVLEGLCRLLRLRPWFRYEKYRSPYTLPGLKGVELDFDETPVGDYVELEGDRRSIDRAARLLGFGKGDYIVKSYGGLHMESLRIRGKGASKGEPAPNLGVPDMLFSKRTPVKK